MLLQLGIRNLPQSEVDYAKQFISSSSSEQKFSDQDIRSLLVNNRLGNKICNYCWKKDPATLRRLQLCNKCFLTWYCSEQCKSADQKKHLEWCCNPQASRDMGPLKTSFAHVKQWSIFRASLWLAFQACTMHSQGMLLIWIGIFWKMQSSPTKEIGICVPSIQVFLCTGIVILSEWARESCKSIG